ncbi:elongation factor 1-beta [Candidatus Woesearchaeota archaeon]|nr:elongation factor 1-beta [Candidatus Woesearchaeota archaeon]
MANVVITIQVMPESLDIDLNKVKEEAKKKIAAFGGAVGKEEIVPVAFGLKAIRLIFVSNEAKGGTEQLEEDIRTIEGVQSAETVDVRRAIG